MRMNQPEQVVAAMIRHDVLSGTIESLFNALTVVHGAVVHLSHTQFGRALWQAHKEGYVAVAEGKKSNRVYSVILDSCRLLPQFHPAIEAVEAEQLAAMEAEEASNEVEVREVRTTEEHLREAVLAAMDAYEDTADAKYLIAVRNITYVIGKLSGLCQE